MSPWHNGWSRIGPIEKAVNDVAAESIPVRSTHREQPTQVTEQRGIPVTSTDPVRSFASMRAHPRPDPERPPRSAVLGYASVEAADAEDLNGDLRQQAREIASECERRGIVLVQVVHDRVPPRQRSLDRPGLAYALDQISAGQAGGLVVSELLNLSHTLPDLGGILEWLTRRDARVIAVAPNIDTEEKAGRLAIRTIIEVSRWERQRLAERTRAGMRAARRKGPASVTDDPELRDRIAGMRAAGMTLQGIANQLNAEGIPTLRGGAMWRPSSVQVAAGYQRPSNNHATGPRAGSAPGLGTGDAGEPGGEPEQFSGRSEV